LNPGRHHPIPVTNCWLLQDYVLHYIIATRHDSGAKPTRFTRGSRKRRIDKACLSRGGAPAVTVDPETEAAMLSWTGEDERGREFEIVAVKHPGCILVIHVMPTLVTS